MISVITPTGGRPFALSVLNKCLERQTNQDFEWIVVDDCDPASEYQPVGKRTEVVRPEPRWARGQNTQARNLLAGLDAARTDRIVICEDDDWYAPNWLEDCDIELQYVELWGEAPSLYYHVSGVGRSMGNTRHASLCSTAMQGDRAIRHFREILKEPRRIDMRLWRSFGGKVALSPFEGRVIGVKGLPGRSGIGVGHTPAGEPMDIRKWIPTWDDDYRDYSERAS